MANSIHIVFAILIHQIYSVYKGYLGNSLLTYDNLSKSLQTFPLALHHSLLSFKTSGLLWPLRKSSAFFILCPRCSDSNPSNTCNKCHMSRAHSKSPLFLRLNITKQALTIRFQCYIYDYSMIYHWSDQIINNVARLVYPDIFSIRSRKAYFEPVLV